ncbi:ABC transporter permease [Abyssisolibacter fermentans]|uniref:ABC transporter permease n=1 Tax=Abyssisolibacter fermentans TaxID=1766203 RepID=UPI00082F869B|nr:ABC transporter permease [Abyssisolibacter fermentans]
MLTGLNIQFKILSKDKMVWVSALFPIILAICIRLFAGDVVIEQSIGYVEGQLSSQQIMSLNQFCVLQSFKDRDTLEMYILSPNSDNIGILYNKQTDNYDFLLQGNELAVESEQLASLHNYLKDSSSFDALYLEAMTNDKDYLTTLLVTITVLMGLFLGSVFNAFNIVDEKEDGIDIVNQILPMSHITYIIQKSIIGFIGSFILGFITLIIVIGVNIPIVQTIILLLLGSVMSTLVGLYLGHYSSDQMVVIIMTKVVLLIFTFVPFIGFFIPNDLGWVKNLFYIVPSYAVFNGIWALVESQDTGIMMINSLFVLLYSVFASVIYWRIRRNKILN